MLMNILINIMIYITYMVKERQGGGGGDIHREVLLISSTKLRRESRGVYSAGLLRSRPTSCALYVL